MPSTPQSAALAVVPRRRSSAERPLVRGPAKQPATGVGGGGD